MSDEEVFKGYVAKAESYAADVGLFKEETYQVVVAAAAEHGAVVFGCLVEHLKNGARIVVKAANDTEIEYAVFFNTHSAYSLKQGEQFLGAL